MTKPQIREIAHSLGLKVADKIDSQEICFVPATITRRFCVRIWAKTNFTAAKFTTLMGIFVGEHDGIELFTIGQRKGLPGGSPRPRYVVDLDPATNRVIVGDADDLVCEEFEIDRVNWHPAAGVATEPRLRVRSTVKIRYNHPERLRQSRPGERSRPCATARPSACRNARTSCSHLRR
jgi:tRNA-specific 2-thiouridylase